MIDLEQKQEIMQAFANYQRWLREGKPKHREQQYYYDPYHAGITEEDGTFSFHIQLYDSPMGDTWWYGTFRPINGGTDIEILSTRTERR